MPPAIRYGILLFAIITVALSSFRPGSAHYSSEGAMMKFDTTRLSFDTMTGGQKISRAFSFKNTGDKRLQVQTVLASDGGTIAYWPEKSIAPNDRGEISVEFGFTNTRTGFQDKTFTVVSNAINSPVVLHLVGYIRSRSSQ